MYKVFYFLKKTYKTPASNRIVEEFKYIHYINIRQWKDENIIDNVVGMGNAIFYPTII